MSEKITGYILLALGLAVIGLSSFSVYQVLTNKAKPVQVFTGPGLTLELPGTKPTEVLPSDTLNDISNLSIHYLLMTFLVSVGFKVGSLGIQLLRPINVEVKSKTL